MQFTLSKSIISIMNALILLFYRIVTIFTRARTKQMPYLQGFDDKIFSAEGGFINDQSSLYEIPYGKGNMADNGCGPIALYNAILFLCNTDASKDKFLEIISYLEKTGAAFKGKLGTAPQAIRKFLIKNGFATKTFFSKNSVRLDKFSEQFDAFISIIFNDSKHISKGLHFIFIKKNTDGSFTAHNPLMNGESLYKTLDNCSCAEIRHVCTIGIKRNQT